MRDPRETDTVPWYRQFWPWFLIALPASWVVLSLATVVIAYQNPAALVVDEYYREGLAINEVLERERRARELGVAVTLRWSDDRVVLEMTRGDDAVSPPALTMRLIHPTDPDRDRRLDPRLGRDGAYVTGLEEPLAGRWRLLIEPPDREWRLERRVELAGSGSLRVTPPQTHGG